MTSRHCERARELVSLRVDGELSELESALLDAHLEGCLDCRDFAVEVESFTNELRLAPLARPTLPVSLPRRWHLPLRGVQLGAAAALIAVVLGVGSLLAVIGTPQKAGGTQHLVGSFRNDDLRELRKLRRAELTFSTTALAPPTQGRRT